MSSTRFSKYNHKKIEAKWQKYWEKHQTFVTKDKAGGKKNLYILDMFPYPSGAGLHVGHPEGYTATDILSRFSRMNQYNVLHPMGWDAFGLPAENYAIKEGIHPEKSTRANINRFREQIKSIGLSYDWTRELATCDSEYYKWTQWLFLLLYKKGLAYKKEASVNWCPKDNTVLANEQVINGKCDRCGSEVVQKLLSQWFFKITNYAERLLKDLDKLDWPDAIKTMQRNWIGKSEGAEIDFPLDLNGSTPNFLILHGRNGSPDSHLFPWLKTSLEKKGFMVQAPSMPKTWEPSDSEQAKFVLKNCKIDQNTVIVGHSFGGVVALRVLEAGRKARRVILVSVPFSGKFLDAKLRLSVTQACQRGFDFKKINQNSKYFSVLCDTSDNIIPVSDGSAFAKNLNTDLTKARGQEPHFSAKIEPEVLSACLPHIKVFTTRPDTLFGATYMVLAPEHPLIGTVRARIKNSDKVEAYINAAKKKTELQRTGLEKEKTGVELQGISAINPATRESVPIWIADYVLMNYGTGAIMAVPAHDERDFAFARKYNLPLKSVIAPNDKHINTGLHNSKDFFLEKGILYDSGEFSGLTSEEAILKIGARFGKLVTKYKIRDWLISRQRYWGAPIPIIYCQACGMQAVPEKDLPVKLPHDVDFRPSGESPLARSKSFHKVKCPKCKGLARRDSDTMDTFVDSSWYYFRYTDANNNKQFADKKKINTWLPVNVYVGGAEHAVLHLLYSRFFTKVLRDLKVINFDEPFIKLRNQGLILGPDGDKMSKSKGNVINPDDVIKELGADSLRMYEMFMGPLEDAKPWNTQGIIGVRRFLDRVWAWVHENSGKQYAVSSQQIDSAAVEKALHKLIKKISEDIPNFKLNTCISAFMEFHNQVKDEPISKASLKTFLLLFYPFAPHICEELNEILGSKRSLQLETWPKYDPKFITDQFIDIVVQINGKVKDKIQVAPDSSEEAVRLKVLALEKVKNILGKNEIKRFIFIPNKVVNLVL